MRDQERCWNCGSHAIGRFGKCKACKTRQ
jgi:hypothetical protein